MSFFTFANAPFSGIALRAARPNSLLGQPRETATMPAAPPTEAVDIPASSPKVRDDQVLASEGTKEPATTSEERSPPSERDRNKKHISFREKLKRALKIPKPRTATCVACDDQFQQSKLIRATCEHQYCRKCVQRMAEYALQDSTIFPARCCSKEIPPDQVVETLAPTDAQTYLFRVMERTTTPAERWYCPKADCRSWIPPRNIKQRAKVQRCPYCRTKICSKCRDLAHDTRPCVADPALGDLLDLARQRRWQRCYRCHTMVERNTGCSHIKCKCGADFCYGCGRKYDDCACRGAPNLQEAGGDDGDGDGDGFDLEMVQAALEQAERWEGVEGTVVED